MAVTLALLAAGADAGVPCGLDKTPLTHFAAEGGHVEILTALIEHGADVHGVDEDQSTAAHFAARFNEADVIHALVEAGADIEARDITGTTPLHVACAFLNHEAVASLLSHSANVNALTSFLETPLMLAAVKAGGAQEPREAAGVVDSLLRAGADEIHIGFDGNTALEKMLETDVEEQNEDFERVVELLTNAPADRAWRRRGYPVLCRAQPERMQQKNPMVRSKPFDWARTPQDSHCDIAGGGNVDEIDRGEWVIVLEKVLGLREEGLFRTIVRYL